MAYLCHKFFFLLKKKWPWPIVAIDQNSFGTCNLRPGCLWGMLFKMATARIRNNDWQEDEGLKETLTRFVRENLRRNEVLDFVSRDFSEKKLMAKIGHGQIFKFILK